MDGVTTTSVVHRKIRDGSTLNSPVKIIVKKENIGLEKYQHGKYQYNLFNNIVKRDQYYNDLLKTKDRLKRNIPNMQQVIHTDIKRVNTNKVYERQLTRDLNGPRGLKWQCKQELQRLASAERDIELDLMRLNRDLTRIALSTPLDQSPSPQQNRELSRSETPHPSFITDTDTTVQTLQKSRLFLGRSSTSNTNRAITVNRFPRINQTRPSITKSNSKKDKSPWIRKQITENRPYLQHNFRTNNQQK